MQTYLVVSVLLSLFITVTTIYAWQAPEDTEARLAILRNAKPTSAQGSDPAEEVTAEASPDVVTISLAPQDLPIPEDSVEVAESLIPEVGSAPDLDSSTLEAGSLGSTNIGPIAFSTDITSDYRAVNPGLNFTEGFFTLYATFNYQDMDSDMAWSWVWKRNGQAIEGGEQQWSYGENGPGYIYFQPEEGFQLGEHSLEVWIDDQLVSQSSFTISEGVSASN